jgi:hypothetical protein
MSNSISGQEPTRPTDAAPANLARLRVEDGMSVDSIFRLFTEAARTVWKWSVSEFG